MLTELEKPSRRPPPDIPPGTDAVQARRLTEEARSEAARVEARASDRELLTPKAAVTLFQRSAEAVRRAIRMRHVHAPFVLQASDKPTALISLSSARSYWREPDESTLDRMRGDSHILGVDGLSYAVLHTSPLVTADRPNTLTSKMEAALNYRWPKKGDRLLRKSQDSESGGKFSRDVTSRHLHIWDGYMSAGAILVTACEEDGDERHSLIYPILSNYRHAVELAMKWIIKMYGSYSTVQIDDIEHHNLWKLWCLCKDIIIELGPDGEAIPIVEPSIKKIHDLDRSGQNFRYSSRKSGTPAPLPDYSIDLPNIRDVMEGVASFFDGVDAQLDACSPPADW